MTYLILYLDEPFCLLCKARLNLLKVNEPWSFAQMTFVTNIEHILKYVLLLLHGIMLKYSSISDISPRHLAFEKKIPSKTAYHVLPIYEKKKVCPRRSNHVLPISKNGSFYIGKSKTFIKNFQDIPRYIIPSHLS